jgi:hypothetical protein
MAPSSPPRASKSRRPSVCVAELGRESATPPWRMAWLDSAHPSLMWQAKGSSSASSRGYAGGLARAPDLRGEGAGVTAAVVGTPPARWVRAVP